MLILLQLPRGLCFEKVTEFHMITRHPIVLYSYISIILVDKRTIISLDSGLMLCQDFV